MGTNTSSHFLPTTWGAKVRKNTYPHTPTHQPTNHENAYNYAAHANINHAYTTCVHSGTKIIENHEFKYYHQRACNKICNNICGIILDNLCCVICIIGHMPNWLASTSRNDFNNIWKVMFQLARGENIKKQQHLEIWPVAGKPVAAPAPCERVSEKSEHSKGWQKG
jgi:hypothetical protein